MKKGVFTVTYMHDSTACTRCVNVKEYYKLRAQLISDTDNFDRNGEDLCGIVSFLMYMEGKVCDGTQVTLAEYKAVKENNPTLLECEPFYSLHKILGFKSSELYYRLNALSIKYKDYKNVQEHVTDQCLNVSEKNGKNATYSKANKQCDFVPNSGMNSESNVVTNDIKTDQSLSQFTHRTARKRKAPVNSVTIARALKKNYLSPSKKKTFSKYSTPQKTIFKPLINKGSLTVHKQTTLKTHRKIKRRKQANSPAPVEDKLPTKGTLKRKRWFLEKLKTTETYEDDIFEKNDLFVFQNLVEDPSDDVYNIATPTLSSSFSPKRESSSSPTFEDCYNQQELQHSRKEAIHYLFRRQKRKSLLKSKNKKMDVSKDIEPEQKPNMDTTQELEEACKVLTKLKNELEMSETDEDEDYYFSDIDE